MPTLPKCTIEDKRGAGGGGPRMTVVWAVAWALLLLLSPVFPREGSNSESRWLLTRAIVERGTLSIDGFEAATHDRAFRDGRWYSDKAPGLSFLGVPALLVVRAAGALAGPLPERTEFLAVRLLTVTLPSFVVLALAFAWLRRRGHGPFEAGLWPAIWWCATPAFVYGNLLFSHQAAAWALAGAFLVPSLLPGRWWAPPLAGLAAGWAISVEYVAVFAVAAFLALHPFPSRRHRIAAAAGVAPPLLLMAAYQWICFGAPWRFGYQFQTWPASSATGQGFFGFTSLSARGLWTVLLSPAHGLLFFAPFAVTAVLLSLRRPRPTWREAVPVLLFLGYAVLFSAYAEPEAGACIGPRHLVPYLPLAVWWALRSTRPGGAGESIAVGLALGASSRTALIAASDVLLPYSIPDPTLGQAVPLLLAGVATRGVLTGPAFPVTFAVPVIGLAVPLVFARGRRAIAPMAVAALFLCVSVAAERAVAPADPRPAAFDLAFTLASLGKDAAALDRIRPFLEPASLTPAQGTLALEILGRVDPPRALEFATRLPEAPGERSRRLILAGEVSWRSGDRAGAKAAFRRAWEGGDRSPQIYLNLALAAESSGRTEEALMLAAEGVRAHPLHAPLRLRAGRLLLEAGRAEEGRAMLREAVRLDPGAPASEVAAELLRGGDTRR